MDRVGSGLEVSEPPYFPVKPGGASWILPVSLVPPLPPSVDRRGLFQLESTTMYLSRQVTDAGANEYKKMKLTRFLV